jgi:CheY-like chemotaxis protein
MAPYRVLVVDDDPDVIEYFSSFLGDHGYLVESASNASQAVVAVNDFGPDVVLIDVMMPGKSGLDLLVTLRRHPVWSGLPVVMITGDDRILQDDCRSYLGSHADVRAPDGVLAKPIDRKVLLGVLDGVCGGRSEPVLRA